MNGNGEKITRHQEKAIAALIQHSTIREAAKATGLSESTLKRWKKQPAFATAYAAARRSLIADTVSMIQKASGAALVTLVRIMTNESAASTARTQAARAVLEMALRERPAYLPFPENSTGGITEVIGAIANAVATGEMRPEDGRAVAEIFDVLLRTIQTESLLERVQAIERGEGVNKNPPEDIVWDCDTSETRHEPPPTEKAD